MIYSIYAPNESPPNKKIPTRAAQKTEGGGNKRGPFASFFHHQRTKPRVILVENKHPSRTAIVNVRGFQHDGMLKSPRKTSSIGQEDPRDQLVTIKPKTKRYITVQKEQVYLYILFKHGGGDEEFYFAPSPERPLDACSEFYVIEEEDLEPSNAEKISFAFYQGQVHLDRLIVSA